MITKQEYQQRLLKIASNMQPNSVMVLIAPESKTRNHDVEYPYRNSSNLLYLTGLNIHPQALIIEVNATNKEPIFHLFLREKDPFFERWMGKIPSKDEVQHINAIKKKNIHSYSKFWNKLEKYFSNQQICYYDFGVSKNDDEKIFSLLYSARRNARAENTAPETISTASQLIHESRLIKSKAEVKIMQQSCDIAAIGHNKLIQFSQKLSNKQGSVDEHSLRAFIENYFFQQGSNSVAYPSIVAGGNNANILHYIECNQKIAKNQLVLVDAGCELHGYAADITRTFPAYGKFTKAQKICYQAVLDAQKKAIEYVSHSKSLVDIHNYTVKNLVANLADIGLFKNIPDIKNSKKIHKNPTVDEIIKNKLYSHYYMHGTSHFLGLDVHDAGKYYLNKKPRLLKEGMIFTIEPGLYISQDYDFVPKEFRGIAIRIEDNILMTQKGYQNLTIKAKKEIKDISQ